MYLRLVNRFFITVVLFILSGSTAKPVPSQGNATPLKLSREMEVLHGRCKVADIQHCAVYEYTIDSPALLTSGPRAQSTSPHLVIASQHRTTRRSTAHASSPPLASRRRSRLHSAMKSLKTALRSCCKPAMSQHHSQHSPMSSPSDWPSGPSSSMGGSSRTAKHSSTSSDSRFHFSSTDFSNPSAVPSRSPSPPPPQRQVLHIGTPSNLRGAQRESVGVGKGKALASPLSSESSSASPVWKINVGAGTSGVKSQKRRLLYL